jgi:hypothetical protein
MIYNGTKTEFFIFDEPFLLFMDGFEWERGHKFGEVKVGRRMTRMKALRVGKYFD